MCSKRNSGGVKWVEWVSKEAYTELVLLSATRPGQVLVQLSWEQFGLSKLLMSDFYNLQKGPAKATHPISKPD